MSRIYNVNLHPSGGWEFIDPQGVKHAASGFKALINVVTAYRKRAKLDPGDPEVEITNQICARHPDFCKGAAPKIISSPVPAGAPRNFISTLAPKVSSWVSRLFGEKRMGRVKKVSAAEARRREQICARCPKQVPFPSSCGGCIDNVNRLSGEIVSEPLNKSIQCCMALAEYTPVSVWLDQPPVDNGNLPEECWRKQK